MRRGLIQLCIVLIYAAFTAIFLIALGSGESMPVKPCKSVNWVQRDFTNTVGILRVSPCSVDGVVVEGLKL